MNWLAHVYLSELDVEHRLGNILADVVKGRDRKLLSPGIRRGIACHQLIDAFTDYHPLVIACKFHFSLPYRPYAGIVLDIYFDHLLAVSWNEYADIELPAFLAELYESFRNYAGQLPELIRHFLGRMAAEDWLGSYRHIEGIKDVLRRVSRRLKRPVALQETLPELLQNHALIAAAFQQFFPQLCAHVRQRNMLTANNPA
jgi:acyl carrier protein phosphodiesterase